MARTPELLAIIPARGGSKGIPRKNLADLGGLPLLAWSIRTALACGNVTRVVVSTDDREIAEVARTYGAETPSLRPAEIADDRAPLQPVVQDLLGRLRAQGYAPDAYCLFLPTSPFRDPGVCSRLLDKILDGLDAVISVKRADVSGLGAGPFSLRPIGYLSAHSLWPRTGESYAHVVSDPRELLDIDEPADLELARALVRKDARNARRG